MPWCPRCDEVFPEGPSCPRCRSALADVSEAPRAYELQEPGELPDVKVSRRLQRAFDRLGTQPAPPRALLAVALALLFFAGGFLIGRMGTVVRDGPVMRTLEAQPFPFEIDGALEYVVEQPDRTREPALVRHDLASGVLDTVARFGSSGGAGAIGRDGPTRLVSFGRSTALMLGGGETTSPIGAFASGRPMPLWVDAQTAAWESASTLLILRNGLLIRWSLTDEPVPEELDGEWAGLFQTAEGAVVLRGDGVLGPLSPQGWDDVLEVPEGARVLAVAPGGRPAMIEQDGETGLWDGERFRPARIEGYRPLGAAFSKDGDRVAVVLASDEQADAAATTVAIVDAHGSPAFRPLESRARGPGCVPVPVWEASERWVFVAPGDGAVYAVEVGGQRVHRAPARAVGCGIAWVP